MSRPRLPPIAKHFYNVAMGSLACWAIIATVGVVSLALQNHANHVALRNSSLALSRSTLSLQRDVANTNRIAAEARGLCLSEKVTISYINGAGMTIRKRLLAIKHLDGVLVGKGFRRVAKAIMYLPPIDCVGLNRYPLSYRVPKPIPYGSPGAPK